FKQPKEKPDLAWLHLPARLLRCRVSGLPKADGSQYGKTFQRLRRNVEGSHSGKASRPGDRSSTILLVKLRPPSWHPTLASIISPERTSGKAAARAPPHER